jgi:hypothetical protein
MNNNANNASYSKISQIVESQNSIAICLPEKATIDAVAASLALYLGLTKVGKDVSIVSSSPVPQDVSLFASDKIQAKLGSGGDTLIVSFPYSEGSIDKVSYNIEGDHFNLLIQPRAGFSKLNPNQVNYTYTGGQVGAMFIIDAPTLQSLGSLYTSDENQFKGHDIINIDRHLTNANYGTVNIVERQSASTSEIVLTVLKSLNIEIDKDMATNLYAGIMYATNNFTAYSVNANTFEACAYLLKLGAIKKAPIKPKAPAFGENRFQQPQKPVQNTMNVQPNQYSQSEAPVQSQMVTENKEVQEESPNEWLKPRIFKGSGVSNI